jgi:glycosyltransferase involved in cell wall biosynthesis
MKTNEKVSIIIPVYGVEKFLDRCLKSIVNQTYKNLEIVLVDDGSKDNSGNICDSWGKKDNRIKVIHQKNKGLSGARNTGLRNISGTYFFAIDSDDYLDLNAVKYLVRAIEETGSDVAIFKYSLTFNQKMIRKVPKTNKSLKYSIKEGIDIHNEIFLTMNYQTFFWNKFYRTDVVKNVFLDEDVKCYEDIESVPRFLIKCNKAVFLKNSLLTYMVRTNSLSHDSTKMSSRLRALLSICSVNESRYKEWYPELGKKMHSFWALQYILFCHDFFTKMEKKEKMKILYNEEFVNEYKQKAKDFSSSSYKFYYKILFHKVNRTIKRYEKKTK